MEQIQSESKPSRFAFYIRVTEQEYNRVMKMCAAKKMTAQELFKKELLSRFDLEKPIYIFTPEQAKEFGVELNRQGNNLNQIAKKINAGLLEGWSRALDSINANYIRLYTRINLNYANSKT